MIEIGRYNTLEVVRAVNFGIYLDAGDEFGDILMPTKYIPEGTSIGDEISALVYRDSEERLIATTEIALAQAGEFALLKVRSVTEAGAFLDWGTSKDLFLPFKEQNGKVKPGLSYLVFMYIDILTGRLVATMKLDKFLNAEESTFSKGDEVEAIIYKQTDLGFKAVILPSFVGMIYENELFKNISVGEKHVAYIKQIRPDGKIDLSLHPLGMKRLFDSADLILEALEKNEGVLYLTDHSAPEEIYSLLAMSKKSFKQGIGKLYKVGKISLQDDSITLKMGQ